MNSFSASLGSWYAWPLTSTALARFPIRSRTRSGFVRLDPVLVGGLERVGLAVAPIPASCHPGSSPPSIGVDFVESGSDPVCLQVQDAYETKYGMRHPPPFWALKPALVLAWS